MKSIEQKVFELLAFISGCFILLLAVAVHNDARWFFGVEEPIQIDVQVLERLNSLEEEVRELNRELGYEKAMPCHVHVQGEIFPCSRFTDGVKYQ